ncbi:putative cyclin-dependent protein kinase complex component [Aspergillus clavatus NRRL 1]|uniref:Cyclin-dependent protein kinase complex component (Pcl7), putative n=1 Tax=Aspergillus clavatus (strain ATCC 1007 / CBS 513.65 / DSM 816 / NCTC 3887 / NRRL 1 / QM 1276 / 107) TaxID=344612 RepID=A1CDE8_ASPCL|nr:cyclin-dependent protein kinase complex component (Pcl7), putative [Aspergillus clavatus NRRL 1]EAW11875.1 cyclin-dependent protein kinase complex component (Pcl7), putative [Aspergillus clavatus NRRL 1]
MGSVVINHSRSEQIDSSYTMLGGAINPSESVIYRSSSHAQHAQHAQPLSSQSRSSSATTTPTSTTAPPSTGSARLPGPHDVVPAYIHRQSHSNSLPSTRASSTTSGPTYTPPHPSVSMSSNTSSHASHRDAPSFSSHSTPYNNDDNNYAQQFGHGNQIVTDSAAVASSSHASPSSPRLKPTFQSLRSLGGSEASSPSRIKVRDLSHIQSFASEEFLAQPQPSQVAGSWSQERQYEISSMPVTDIIEMVAGLLTKITSTNDMHHEQVHRHIPPPDSTANLSPQATSVLAFHGKNVPSISILSYLTRIHKYCPTTYEVFLSLLVYFDRMTELVNKGQLDRLRHRWGRGSTVQTEESSRSGMSESSSTGQQAQPSPMVTPPSSTGMRAQDPKSPSSISPSLYPQDEEDGLSHFFVVDSFNIHRLVIAGVTCASKFFSDVFYTNSRYAKVGGLPLVELNHLELQFLHLNDFRLSIAVEELEAYGTMLVEFYAREIIAQQQQQQQAQPHPINPSASDPHADTMYMRSHEKHRATPPEPRQTSTPP